MPIDVTCPDCSKRFRVPDAVAGKRIACKSCGSTIPVPSSEVMDAVEVSPKPKKPQRKPKPSSQSTSQSSTQSRRRSQSSGKASSAKTPPGKKSSRPKSSGKQSSPRKASAHKKVYDDFDDDLDGFGQDDYGDPFQGDFSDDYGSSQRQKSSQPKGREKWVRISLLILAIACCVRTASFGCEFVLLVLGATRGTQSIDLIVGLLKADVWLHLLAFAGMIIAYIFMVMGPDRSGSQLWGIGALVMGLIGAVLFFILRILPLMEESAGSGPDGALNALLGGIVGDGATTGLLDSALSLWNLVFRQWVLVAVYLIHMMLALMFVKSFFHASKKASAKPIAGQCRAALILLGAHAAFIFFQGMLTILVIEVIFPAAKEAAKTARDNYLINGGEPPVLRPLSNLWKYMVEGLGWASKAAFLAFLIVSLKIYFSSWNKAAK